MSMLRWHGARVTAQVEAAAGRALLDAGEHVLETGNRTIPHQDGTMMRSGKVTRLEPLLVAVSYDTPYAVRQHEDVRLRHAPGRRARWLALTLEEEKDRVVDYIRDQVRRVL